VPPLLAKPFCCDLFGRDVLDDFIFKGDYQTFNTFHLEMLQACKINHCKFLLIEALIRLAYSKQGRLFPHNYTKFDSFN
jgi:hypothetical protein